MSKMEQIRKSFLEGERLTVCECARKFMTGDLRKYVSRLRRQGLPIKDIEKPTKSGARYKVYFL